MKIFDVEQCYGTDFFILACWPLGYRTGPLHRQNLCISHALKQFEIAIWFHANDISVHVSDPKFTHALSYCSYQMPTLFSKEHVISGSYPDKFSLRMRPTWPTMKVTQIVRVIWPTFNPGSYMSNKINMQASWSYHKTGNFGIVKLWRNLIQRILTKEILTKF